jgi:hypothetical protein
MDVSIPCACTLDTSLHPCGLKTSLRLYGLVRIVGFSDTPASIPPHTQDLTAIEILRSVRAIDSLVNGDINDAIRKQWESLPMGPGQANRPLNGHPSGQPYMPYDDVLTTYKKFGGTTK